MVRKLFLFSKREQLLSVAVKKCFQIKCTSLQPNSWNTFFNTGFSTFFPLSHIISLSGSLLGQSSNCLRSYLMQDQTLLEVCFELWTFCLFHADARRLPIWISLSFRCYQIHTHTHTQILQPRKEILKYDQSTHDLSHRDQVLQVPYYFV